MTYLSDKNKAKKRNIKLGVYFVLFVCLIFSWVRFQSVVYPYLEPVTSLFSGAKNGVLFLPRTVVTYFTTRSTYEKRITDLEDNVERLENEVALKDGELKTYATLDEEKNEGAVSAVTILAHPLMMDVTTMYSTIILSKGYRDGVEEGMIVYVRGMQGVGYISKLHDKTSELYLFSAPKNKIEGVTKDEYILPLVGMGGGNFFANIPKENELKVGDDIFYRSNPNIKLGTISDIKNDPQDVFMRVYIQGAYNPAKSNNFFMDK